MAFLVSLGAFLLCLCGAVWFGYETVVLYMRKKMDNNELLTDRVRRYADNKTRPFYMIVAAVIFLIGLLVGHFTWH